jgi:hypothetical protein
VRNVLRIAFKWGVWHAGIELTRSDA